MSEQPRRTETRGPAASPAASSEGQAPTTNVASSQAPESAVAPEDPQQSAKLFALAMAFIAVLGYMLFSLQEIRWQRTERAQENLEKAIRQFPKNPSDYNVRQLEQFRAGTGWRRFNFRNIGILAGASLASLLVARWHRKRREFIARRKSLAFWLWTMGAGFFGVLWGVYMIKRATGPERYLKMIRRNPTIRALFIIGLIILVSLCAFVFKLSRRKTKKEKMMQEWRNRKHREMMAKRDIYNKPMLARPIQDKAAPAKT